MIKKQNLMLLCVGLIFLALPIIGLPILVSAYPEEFPIINKSYKMEANLKSSKDCLSMVPVNTMPRAELENLLKKSSSEAMKAGFMLGLPFGKFGARIYDMMSELSETLLSEVKKS